MIVPVLEATSQDNLEAYIERVTMLSDLAEWELHEAKKRIAELEDVLSDLVEKRNGIPLIKYEKRWQEAMEKAQKVLEKRR